MEIALEVTWAAVWVLFSPWRPVVLTDPGEFLLLLAGAGEYSARGVHAGPIRERVTHLPDDGFEGPERVEHVSIGKGAHRSPTPHLPGHLALSAGDHDAVLVEQFRQNCRVVEAVRRPNARDGDRMHAVAREDLHPERLDGFMKLVRVARVTGPDVEAAFAFVQIDCDVECEGDRDRGRPRRLALVEEFLVLAQIEVEARRRVRFDLLPRARTHRDHRQSRRARQRLLRRGADDIEFPLVHLLFARCYGDHRVDDDVGG